MTTDTGTAGESAETDPARSADLSARARVAMLLVLAAYFSIRAALNHGISAYNLAQNAVSYFDTGFARRELEGTLIRLFTANPTNGVLIFHFLTYAMLTVAGCVLVCGPSLRPTMRWAIGAVFAAVLIRVALDVGRADAAIMICGCIASWAVARARWIIAASAVFVALLFHENGLIVLGPLSVAVAWACGSWRQWRSKRMAAAMAIAGVGLVAYALSFPSPGNVADIARRVRQTVEIPAQGDLATYANLTGLRAMRANVCANLMDPSYPARVASGVELCIILAIGLQPKRIALALAVALIPFLFLSAVSVDIGRWATFAAFSLFALTSVTDAKGAGGWWSLGLAFVAAGLMTATLRFDTVGFAPIPLVEDYSQAHGMHSATPIDAITACDPGWQSTI